jgi:hypothetical protein
MKDLVRTRVKRVAFTVAAVFLPVVVVEGASSLLLFASNLTGSLRTIRAGEDWVTFDPRVGAVARPNAHVVDPWGTGAELRTNDRGFRNTQDFTTWVPADKVRVICSGDSYTMGQGVSNADAWCEQLTALEPKLETLNLGQSGYGFDNAYLRYRHQAADLDHDVHLFAFITDDLYRMHGPTRWRWQSPLLQVRDGELSIPDEIPCLPCRHEWLLPIVVQTGQTGTFRLLRRAGGRLGLLESVDHEAIIREIATHAIEDLTRRAAERRATLVLVHLPTAFDGIDARSEPTRAWLASAAESRSIPYLDLIVDFDQLPRASTAHFFLPEHVDRGRHYTPAGHLWIAERVRDALARTPEILARL